MVVMNGQINAARDVTKTNTSQVETFRSLEFGALGVVDVETVRFYRSPLRRQTLTTDSRTSLPRVEIVTSYAGADGRSIRSLSRDGDVDAVVVTGLGLGGVPGAMFDAIQEARAKGIPVVVGTRVNWPYLPSECDKGLRLIAEGHRLRTGGQPQSSEGAHSSYAGADANARLGCSPEILRSIDEATKCLVRSPLRRPLDTYGRSAR